MNGILYVAFGESYLAEVKVSLASVKHSCPNMQTCVVTDYPWTESPLPDQFVIREPIYGFECKPTYIYSASPFENTLYLDTDTYVARDVSLVFNLLDYYDVGVTFGGNQLGESGIECHTQCSSSTILFRKGDAVKGMFEAWNSVYSDAKGKASLDRTDPRGLGDQRYLAIAIARSTARPVALASYFNFLLGGVCTTNRPPYIYTGRNVDYRWADYVLTNKWVAEKDWWGRTWMGNIKGVFPRGVRRSDPLLAFALIGRRFVNELKQFFWLRSKKFGRT